MGKATRFTTRKEIRKKICEVLRDSLVSLDGRVYANRTRPVGVEELPIVLIYPTDEDYTKLNQVPLTLRRDATISVQIIASDSEEETMSDILDDLAEEIEDTIEVSDKLDGLVHDINIDTGNGTLKGDGQKPEGSWILNFNVTYIRKPKE